MNQNHPSALSLLKRFKADKLNSHIANTMTMKSTKYLLLGGLCLFSLLFPSCKGEPSCPNDSEQYSYLPEGYKKILPYTGFDTLLFLTNTNDTIRCIGTGRSTFFESDSKRDPNPDCNVYTKTIYDGYKDNYSNVFVGIGNKPPEISGGVWIPRFHITWSNIDFIFTTNLVGSKTADTTNGKYKYYDSINILNTYFKEVSEITIEGNKVFLNQKNGIVRLYDSKNNSTWNLIK